MPVAPTEKPNLPALALAAPLSSASAVLPPDLVVSTQLKLARGPPPRKIPIFLSCCALLH
jgi:hypothetical protein